MTLMTQPTPGISAFPASPTDMMKWNATLSGPAETCYAGMTFKLTLAFPANYPYAPPEVLFKTPVYHPNVDFAGRICLSVLERKNEEGVGWSAALNTGNVLLSVQSLLGEPNP
jgi:ubiquitin-conjugating enzyme E2 C